MAREIWVTDIAECTIESGCVRAVFTSGRKQFVLRGSRNTLVKALGLGTMALKQVVTAEVLSLRHGD